MFTAMLAERGCAICKEAAAEYHILANSIRYTGSQENGYQNKTGASSWVDGPEPLSARATSMLRTGPKGLTFIFFSKIYIMITIYSQTWEKCFLLQSIMINIKVATSSIK